MFGFVHHAAVHYDMEDRGTLDHKGVLKIKLFGFKTSLGLILGTVMLAVSFAGVKLLVSSKLAWICHQR